MRKSFVYCQFSSSLIFLILLIMSETITRQIPETKIVIDDPIPTPPPVAFPTASAVTPQRLYAATYPSCEMNPQKPHALP